MEPAQMFVLIAVTIGVVKLLTGPIGTAIGDRIRGGRHEAAAGTLAVEVDRLQARLSEVEERLDFAERLLARGGEVDQIQGGAIR
jgi:hypothetical protein